MSAIPEEKYKREKEYVLSVFPNTIVAKQGSTYIAYSNGQHRFLALGKRIDKAWKHAAMKTAELRGEYNYGQNWKNFKIYK